jgi:hypothetical protein
VRGYGSARDAAPGAVRVRGISSLSHKALGGLRLPFFVIFPAVSACDFRYWLRFARNAQNSADRGRGFAAHIGRSGRRSIGFRRIGHGEGQANERAASLARILIFRKALSGICSDFGVAVSEFAGAQARIFFPPWGNLASRRRTCGRDHATCVRRPRRRSARALEDRQNSLPSPRRTFAARRGRRGFDRAGPPASHRG